MTTRILRISIPVDLDVAFAFVARCINSAGLTIENPETGKITSWSDDGEQVVTASEEILSKVRCGELLNVQFWSSPSDDMFVSWARDNSLCTFFLYLDGVDVSRSVAVASKLIEALITDDNTKKVAGDVFTLNVE